MFLLIADILFYVGVIFFIIFIPSIIVAYIAIEYDYKKINECAELIALASGIISTLSIILSYIFTGLGVS